MHALIIPALVITVLLAIFMATGPNLKDAALRFTRALPASTAAVTSAAGQILDLGITTTLGTQSGNIELLITPPAVTTAQLPDAKTFTYKLIQSDNADLSSPSDIYTSSLSPLLQTGAGGVGAAAPTPLRVRLPSNCKRYVGLTITPSGSGTGDASGVSATVEVLV